jgi:hypothetical protein
MGRQGMPEVISTRLVELIERNADRLTRAWLGDVKERPETRTQVYTALGRQRYEEGFAPSEVLEALILSRRHLWLLVLQEGFLETALDMHAALDLNARAVLFFDRSMYYTALGFEQAAAEAAAKKAPAQPAKAPARRLRRWTGGR